MKLNSLIYSMTVVAIATFSSCKKDNPDGAFVNNGNFTDTEGSLKTSAAFPIGFAVEFPLFSTNTQYATAVKNEVNSITFGNELKNDFIVKADGTYDFTRADNFYNAAKNAGIEVFGHTLVWHSQQRATYYKSLIGGGTSGPGVTNLAVNPGFETTPGSSGDIAEGWQVLNLRL